MQKHLEFYSDIAWLCAFLEHRLWLDYVILTRSEIDAREKIEFHFTDGERGELAMLELRCYPNRSLYTIRLIISGNVCRPEEFVRAVKRTGVHACAGAIGVFIQLICSLQERTILMREAAYMRKNELWLKRVLAFDYEHVPFLGQQLEHLQEIRSQSYEKARLANVH